MNQLSEVDVTGGEARVAGIVELERSESGIVLHRMPAWARAEHNDIALSLMETMPSGGRLEMVTDATKIELDVDLTLLRTGADAERPACFELVVDGDSMATCRTNVGTAISVDLETGGIGIEPGPATSIHFDGLPAGEKQVEVWLPQGVAVRLIQVRTDGSRVAAPRRAARRWVHYGSSISHGLEADEPTGVWPVVAARKAGVDLQSFAFAGQCQLDPFVGRMIGAEKADLISLKLGINVVNGDTMRERTFVPAVHGLLDSIREHHAAAPIVLITPITCPVAEDRPGPTKWGPGNRWTAIERPAELAVGALTLQRIRELEDEIVAARRAAGDGNLHILQGPELFGPDDLGDLPDGLHPNSAGYRRMGERFHAWAFDDGPFAG